MPCAALCALVPLALIASASSCGEAGRRSEPEPERAPVPAPLPPPPAPEPAAKPPAPIAPTTPHPFSVLDMLAAERISDPQVSPDGTRVAFTVRTTDLEANRGRTDVFVVDLGGGAPLRITDHADNDDHARWSSDGTALYFASRRSGSSQVWKVPAAGGTATQVTDFPIDVGNPLLSRDGTMLAFSAEVFVDCGDLQCTRTRLDQIGKPVDSGKAYDRVFVRHWDAWEDGRRSHLFVMPVAGGAARDLTAGLDADVPSQPFGGDEEYAFSPDGKQMVFTARVDVRGEPWSTDFDLYAVPIDGSAPARCLTEENPAWDTKPVFSPDGKTLVHLAMKRPGYEADRFHVVARPWPEGPARALTDAWDRSVETLAFSRDGARLWVTAEDVGEQALFSIDLADGKPTRILGEGRVSAAVPAGERILIARETLAAPAELHTVAADGGDLRPVTRFNVERMALARTGKWEHFGFAGARGDTVWAYLVEPVDRDPARKYPLALLIHGGPQGSFGNAFSYRWNPQAFAGAGYAVLMIDFHGSTGYGQAFTDAIRGDWGGKPLDDLKKGLAAALARHDWIDGDRVCAAGGSYGGFMVAWIAGVWPDRFRCLVNHDGVFDNRAMYYETEELWFPEWEHGGPHFSAPAGYERHNPVSKVSQWKSPMLVIHGENDHRVPITQGLAAFNAAQRRGVDSRFLYFPDENHWVLKPRNSRRWYEEVLGWMDRHTGSGKAP